MTAPTTDVRSYTLNLTANQAQDWIVTGTKFVITAATGAVDVDLDTGGKYSGLLSSQGHDGKQFSRLLITDKSGAPNTVTIQVSGDSFVDRRFSGTFSGVVQVTSTKVPQSPSVTSSAGAVTNASAALSALNLGRQYWAVQNNHATGNIFVNLAGAVATVLNGVKVAPGQLWEPPVMPTNAITAIGDIANNTAIVVVEAS